MKNYKNYKIKLMNGYVTDYPARNNKEMLKEIGVLNSRFSPNCQIIKCTDENEEIIMEV